MATACRLIVDAPANGAWNMAADEVLFGSAAEQGIASLRFYRWDVPTLSLGYFQRYAEREAHSYSHSCPAVRRSTGGGAILHDRELTYSLALPRDNPLAANPDRLYNLVHVSLIIALNEKFGAKSSVCVQLCESARSEGPQPFLCFQRRGQNDVVLAERSNSVVGEWKIAGSAQRRRRGAVLQHGSVLLAKSSFAPELPGISDLTGQQIEPFELSDRWTARLSDELGLSMKPQPITAAEADFANRTVTEKFASSLWTNRR
ncbi:MAG: hypothetical protein WD851_04225 [Pirellulales bacterium]